MKFKNYLIIYSINFFLLQGILYAQLPTNPTNSDGEAGDSLTLKAHFFTGLNNEHYMTLSENGSREDVTDLRLAVLQTPEEIEAMTWEDFLAEALPHAILKEAGVIYVGTLVVPGDLNEDEDAVEAFDIAFEEEIWPAWDHQLTIAYQGKIVGCKVLAGQEIYPTQSFQEYGPGRILPGPGNPAYVRPGPPSLRNLLRQSRPDLTTRKAIERHIRKKNKKARLHQKKMRKKLNYPGPFDFFLQ